jgi:neutral ceramidase
VTDAWCHHSPKVQVWTFGPDLVLVALGGEVVVDYALRLARELPFPRVWVAGYSNDVFGYVPSLRVLREGGYEGGDAMIYYGRPGPFAENVEELIVAECRRLASR